MLSRGERIGDWIVDAVIGEGGMGAVLRCHHALDHDRVVALKVLHRGMAGGSRRRFMREVESLARMEHPVLVRVHDWGEDTRHGVLYFAMDLLDGVDLHAFLQHGRMDWRDASRVMRDIADGLRHAHELGLAHRDIKPSNIFVCRDSSVRLVDFGVALDTDRTRVTGTGETPGTLSYLPPEVFRRDDPDAFVGDIYAFGQTLYEALVGRPAFDVPDRVGPQVMAKVMALKLASPALDPGPSVPVELRYVVRQCTEPDPKKRPRSMAELVIALDSVLAIDEDDGDAFSEDPDTDEEDSGPGPWDALERLAPLLLAGMLLLLGVVIAGFAVTRVVEYVRAIEPSPPPAAALAMPPPPVAIDTDLAVGEPAIAGLDTGEDTDPGLVPSRIEGGLVRSGQPARPGRPKAAEATAPRVGVAKGMVKVRSNMRAVVTVDGRARGYTPGEFELVVGSHTLVASLPGESRSETRVVDVVEGGVLAVQFSF